MCLPLLALLGACGGQDEPTDTAEPATSATSPDPKTTNSLDDVEISGGGTDPFEVSFASPLSVDSTLTKVVEEGTGADVAENSTVLLDYVGIDASDGREFVSSWSPGATKTFPLVRGQVMTGLLDGLVGQQVGSQLLIAVPPADGFGAQGNPQAGIQPTDSLLFAVQVRAVSDPDPLAEATGKARELPAGVPTLETDADGVPTGFAVSGQPPKTPTELGVHPVIEGSGPVVEKGDLLTVHYVGQIFPDGEIFDESWSGGQPATFQVGTGGLIAGWDQGLVGQRVGSRVVLVIPPDLGYGEQGQPPTIPGGASLIFAVDILGTA
jgi:peptidylprolyl isomerase